MSSARSNLLCDLCVPSANSAVKIPYSGTEKIVDSKPKTLTAECAEIGRRVRREEQTILTAKKRRERAARAKRSSTDFSDGLPFAEIGTYHTNIETLLPSPADAFFGLFDEDALGDELGADCVRLSEVAGLASGGHLLDLGIDLCI